MAILRPTGPGNPTPITVYYVHADHLGSPRAITRPSDNQLLWRWDNTDPFGNNAANENPAGQGTFKYGLRFPGQYYDAETGTHYNYFRDYDPTLGRYSRSDPLGLKAGKNTYTYVNGAPTQASDPLGLIKWTGSVSSYGAGPYSEDDYTLTSECACGHKATVKVNAYAFSFGKAVTWAGGNVEFTDHFSCPRPEVFDGPYFKVSAAAVIYMGPAFSFILMGGAASPGGWSVGTQIDLGAGVAIGKAFLQEPVDWARCGCN